MSILAECPFCHKKQSVQRKRCACGADLVQLKGQKEKVKYWIQYYVDKKQRREPVSAFEDLNPYSIEDAKKAEAKRTVQKVENKLFDIKADTRTTFNELAKWYLALEKVKALSSYWRIEISLKHFNGVFGDRIISQIKPADLENYQAKQKALGKMDNTIDHEIGAAKAMVYKAFDNDIVGGDTLRTFKTIRKMLKRNSNARNRILTGDEYQKLIEKASDHLKEIILMGYHTGMRRGEILGLTWNKVFLDRRVICLQAQDTKDKEPREIPMTDEVYAMLSKKKDRIRKAGSENHVFLFRKKQIYSINSALKNACDKAGIPFGRKVNGGFVFHDLRHTFNTNMRKAGVPESVIMEITGHSTREMFDRYNTIDHEDRQKAVNQLQAFFGFSDQSSDQAPISQKIESHNSHDSLTFYEANKENTAISALNPAKKKGSS